MHRLLFSFFLVTLWLVGCGGSDDAPMGGQGGEGGQGATGGVGGQAGVGGSLACDEQNAAGGDLGGGCRGDTFSCNRFLECVPERVTTVGPNIENHPDGPDHTFDVVEFKDNVCLGLLPPSFPADLCSAENTAACAQECGLCLPRYTDADVCLRGCRAEADNNSQCRDGYQCDLLLEVCDTGCSNDDDCRVFINESDALEYDTESSSICNLDTYRCEHLGTPGAEAGIACNDDEECEAKGICLDEDLLDFPGGYCSKLRCDLDGCAGDGICVALIDGIPLCAESCQVGEGAIEGDPSTYLNNTQGCRDGYTCFWVGLPEDPTGACVPGEFNEVTDNNIGAVCAESSECYSPFGQGACVPSVGCTVFDCAVPGMPTDVCGDDAECVLDEVSQLSVCLAKCASAEECVPGAACAGIDDDPLTLDTVCFPTCREDMECRAGETCTNIVNGFGECA